MKPIAFVVSVAAYERVHLNSCIATEKQRQKKDDDVDSYLCVVGVRKG